MSKILSVIIPLYNSAKWVEKCLESVLDQDVPKEQMEIICVNDGSPDNSAEIVRAIGERLEVSGEWNPIVVIDQENQGPSGARNNGLKHATGKYLCFVDPDDFVQPNVYGGLLKQMEEEQLDMLRFNYQIVDEHYNIQPQPDSESRFDYSPKLMTGEQFLEERLGFSCYIWLYIYRREIITKNEIWCFTGDYFDDTPWLPLVLQKASRVNIIDKVVNNYYQRSDSLVKAVDTKTLKKKSNGYSLLLTLLEKELENITNPGVIAWYKQMEAIVVISWLTLVSVHLRDDMERAMTQIAEQHLLPLSTYHATKKTKRKIRLINLSPRLYVWIMQLKKR